jgi:hypothetical protein
LIYSDLEFAGKQPPKPPAKKTTDEGVIYSDINFNAVASKN